MARIVRNMLAQIVADRRRDVAAAARRRPLRSAREIRAGRRRYSFAAALDGVCGTRIVAELKKASPSAGLIRKKYDPVALAREYEAAGAAAISVLTEPRYFLGAPEHLAAVRKAVKLPILRKDFIIDSYQVRESAAIGADAILLITTALDDHKLHSLYDEAMACGLEVMVEAHTLAELRRALELDSAVIGINSRNLGTLKTSLGTLARLADAIPSNRLCVAESGLRARSEIMKLEDAGYDGFLIGEALLRACSAGGKLRELIG